MFSCGMNNLEGDNSSVKELNTTLSLFFPRYDGNSLLSSIECYDPVLDTWEVVTSMATQRCDAGVCVLREK